MTDYQKPERWKNPRNKLFTHQVGFTAPPHDFDAAPSDFLRIAPDNVGAHGRMLHLKGYEHQLKQRKDNFFLLEEFVECMANNGADVCGQVGTNWVHASGTTPEDIRQICDRISDTYETPFHMAGYCLVEGLREIGAEKIALNSVYYWPDWRDGIARFLKEAGFDLLYYGNLVDLGFYQTQEQLNDEIWIMPEEYAEQIYGLCRRTSARGRCHRGQRHAELGAVPTGCRKRTLHLVEDRNWRAPLVGKPHCRLGFRALLAHL